MKVRIIAAVAALALIASAGAAQALGPRYDANGICAVNGTALDPRFCEDHAEWYLVQAPELTTGSIKSEEPLKLKPVPYGIGYELEDIGY